MCCRGGVSLYLSRVKVSGLRASAEGEIDCEIPGRFSVLIGANGAGKTTVTDALYLAHTSRFPLLPRMGAAALPSGGTPGIEVQYNLEESVDREGPLGQSLYHPGRSNDEEGHSVVGATSRGERRRGSRPLATRPPEAVRPRSFVPCLAAVRGRWTARFEAAVPHDCRATGPRPSHSMLRRLREHYTAWPGPLTEHASSAPCPLPVVVLLSRMPSRW
ncbi:AAA family ATPase [Streptomyces albogriseolus]|uniref:AAA family ATPase n=1 Tax=Streptomyces albogriseolus TaxID=1887 RepID=UPI00338E650B